MVFQAIFLGVELFFWRHILLSQEINMADGNVSKDTKHFLQGVKNTRTKFKLACQFFILSYETNNNLRRSKYTTVLPRSTQINNSTVLWIIFYLR